ncbi:MAG: aldehyde ferredoxin oxidoreductase family protein [Candidatus Thermoplasmatota archaeon]
MYGIGGNILEVKLKNKKISKEKTNEKIIKKYLGGLGLAIYLYNKKYSPKAEAFSHKNLLIFSPGMLLGLPISCLSKSIFLSISPLTNTIAESSVGGSIGMELKSAGYDALVIKGRAEKSSYLVIENENVELRDAKELWGMDTRETRKCLSKELKEYKFACIGIAGERLVRYACIDCDGRQAGRGGLGAVMGSKNLKGIAVKGNKDIIPAEPNEINAILDKWLEITIKDPNYILDTKYGTGDFLEWINSEVGTFPTKNWQESVFEKRKKLDPYYWANTYSKKNNACFSCLKPCGKLFVIEKGKYKTIVDGVEYETLYSLGGNCGIENIEAVAKGNELCDIYGLDTISTGASIAFAMELYEKGIIKKNATDGIELKFGNEKAMIEMIKKIGKREGFGYILGEGVKRASEKIGNESKRYAIHVKGMEPPGYDVRGLKGLALGFMVSSRGACHLRSCLYAVELTGNFWKFKNIDRNSYKGKGKILKEMEDAMVIYDCLGACKFSRGIFFLNAFPNFLKIYNGIKLNEKELLEIGSRINDLKRIINLSRGFGRNDDKLPRRILEEPIKNGRSKGNYIKEEEAEKMLSEYYKARGWSKEGIPKKYRG